MLLLVEQTRLLLDSQQVAELRLQQMQAQLDSLAVHRLTQTGLLQENKELLLEMLQATQPAPLAEISQRIGLPAPPSSLPSSAS